MVLCVVKFLYDMPCFCKRGEFLFGVRDLVEDRAMFSFLVFASTLDW